MNQEFLAIHVLKENPNDEFVFLVEWKATDGTWVKKDDLIAILETSKAAVELLAPVDGVLRHVQKAGVQVPIGQTIGYLCKSEKTLPPGSVQVDLSAPSSEMASTQKFSAKAKKLLLDHGLSEELFATFTAVKEKDVLVKVAQMDAHPKSDTTDTQVADDVVFEDFSRTKLFEISNLERSCRDRVGSSVVKQLDRKVIIRSLAERGDEFSGVSMGDVLVHALGRTLPSFMDFNGYYENGRFGRYRDVNIGVAINIMDQGLKVPVLRHVDRMSLLEVSAGIKDLAMKYLREELTPADFIGCCFTVTDLFLQGVTLFDPVINLRQSAILGICSPGAGSDIFNIVLKFDHKVSDGLRAAAFLGVLQECVERVV